MKPRKHRTVPLAQAVDTFALQRLLGDDFDELIADRLDDDSVLIVDGDFASSGDLDLNRVDSVVFGEAYDRQQHGLIIVDGNLEIPQIDLWRIAGLLVLGDLSCDEIHLREGYFLYVQGNLAARRAVYATAMQEGPGYDENSFGPLYVRIQGSARSPRTKTWFMPLQHLAWTSDSGVEQTREVDEK